LCGTGPTSLPSVGAASLEGRRFRSVANVGGEVGTETIFSYAEDDTGEVWASYRGGGIRRGFLVGRRAGDRVEFRYVQLNDANETSSGHCVSTVSTLPDGRLRLDETWEWESRPGSGTSAVEEMLDPAGLVSPTEPTRIRRR
jgi:hypothetical protein